MAQRHNKKNGNNKKVNKKQILAFVTYKLEPEILNKYQIQQFDNISVVETYLVFHQKPTYQEIVDRCKEVAKKITDDLSEYKKVLIDAEGRSYMIPLIERYLSFAGIETVYPYWDADGEFAGCI